MQKFTNPDQFYHTRLLGGETINQMVARKRGYTGPFGGGGHNQWLDKDPGRRQAHVTDLEKGWAAYQTPDPSDDWNFLGGPPGGMLPSRGGQGGSASVADGVARITGKLSPLLTQAQTRAMQGANRRGLLNSSMAGGAAESAIIDAALPIASQDAAQSFQHNLSRQDYQQRQSLAEQSFGHKQSLAEQSFGHETTLRDQSFGYDEILQRLDIDSRERIASQSITATERKDASTMIGVMTRNYAELFANIANNQNIPAEARNQLNAHIGAMRDADLSFVEQMYNIDLEWPSTGAPGG